MSEVKHSPGPTGLPRYFVRVDGDAEWPHDSISAALDHAARRIYMGPVAKVQEAEQVLREGRTYRYAYESKQVEIEPTGPEIPPFVVAASPKMLKTLKSVLHYLDGLAGPFNHELLGIKEVIADAEGRTNAHLANKENSLPVSKRGA